MIKVDNAIILAAGTSSRFAPLSYEQHKALTVVKGEILIERQIEQLLSAGVSEIYIVTGYKAEHFDYLQDKYDVKLIYNPDYLTKNNNGSIWAAKNEIKNSYICSSDNYFVHNPFESTVDDSYYAAEFTDGYTAEWCMSEDEDGYINSVTIGGENDWYMIGHTFWSQSFSNEFLRILELEYDLPETNNKLWESIFRDHLDTLKMRIRKYPPGDIFEFDTIDELRSFDTSYLCDTRSKLIKKIANELEISEADIVRIASVNSKSAVALGFEFDSPKGHFRYLYDSKIIEK